MMDRERVSAKQSVAQPLRLLLKNIKNLGCILAFGEVANQISLFRRYHHAYLIGAGSDHALDQILRDRLRTFHAIHQPRAHGKQFFRAAERLNALSHSRCGNNSYHATSVLAR